jgi:hypothetical protein
LPYGIGRDRSWQLRGDEHVPARHSWFFAQSRAAVQRTGQ